MFILAILRYEWQNNNNVAKTNIKHRRLALLYTSYYMSLCLGSGWELLAAVNEGAPKSGKYIP